MVLVSRRACLVAGGTVAIAAVARKSAAQAPRGFAAAEVSDAVRPLPPLAFSTADGTAKSLADYAGRLVILNLWATWCVPCVAEMPDLDRLASQLGDRVAVLPLSSDRAGAPVVESFYKAHGIASLPVLLDHQGAAMHLLGARGIPTTILIDRTGQERARLEGAVSWVEPASLTALNKILL